MKTPIVPDNPFGCGRHGFAWAHVPAESACHLDFGCYEGKLLGALREKGVGRVVGLDANRDAIERAGRLLPDARFVHAVDTVPLPFEDGAFTSISLLDVLEHLHLDDQRALLNEFNRVLREGGRLIVTVPRQHVFSFMDVGNLKFRFPWLHRGVMRLRYAREEYERRYVSNPDGMIGDVSAKKRWHEHFRAAYLASLLEEAGFQVVTIDGSGLFMRPLSCVRAVIGWVPMLGRLARALMRADASAFESANLYALAVKPALPNSGA